MLMTQGTTSAFTQGQQQSQEQQQQQQQRTNDSTFAESGFDHSLPQATDLVSADPSSTSTTTYYQPFAMNGIVGTAPPGAMYVRALYDYEADDRTSLSFHEGDVIQVITQLESGWWDGVINGVRGWFPSNYCQTITSPDELPELDQQENPAPDNIDDEYDDDPYDDDDGETSELEELPLEGTTVGEKSKADYWIPQATPDGRLFYYNTMTGETSSELPLESPSSVAENGPRDRMNVNIPDRTRPPPELMARGLMQDEDDEFVTSESEMEGENIMYGRTVRQCFHGCRVPRAHVTGESSTNHLRRLGPKPTLS